MKTKFVLVISMFFLLTSAAFAFDPIRDAKLLWEAKSESVARVETARVLLADYALIRRDFPEVREFSNDQIDAWLLRNTSFISLEQAAQAVVNSPIQTSTDRRQAYRPREYRRAHVFAVDTGGLIDAKGTGSIDPSGGSHDNGLATLGDMIREYAYEKLIHAVFEKHGRFDSVGGYAVIDYGFDIIHPDGGRSRAGTVLRQAHERYHSEKIGKFRTRNQPVMLPRAQQLEIEFFLRKLGITSAVHFAGNDLINIQGTKSGAVVDFGSFLVEKEFRNPLAHFYNSTGNTSYTPDIVMRASDRNFIKPDPRYQIPFDIWGYSETGKADSKYDNPFIWSHRLADSIAAGTATRADAEQHIRNFFDTTQMQNTFLSIPRACQKVF